MADYPKILGEAIDGEIEAMPEASKQVLRSTPRDEIIGKFHHRWGRSIRNRLGLWEGNKELLESCGETHPDSASSRIMEGVWEKLGGYQPLEESHSLAEAEVIDLNE